MSAELATLARLVAQRNVIDAEIARVVNRPALVGHLGEFIASRIFDIELASSAVNKGHDGRFRSGRLKGRSVNVKYYGKREGELDIRPDALPDYFLVLAGPAVAPASSVGTTRPFRIDEVFLFEAAGLVRALQASAKPPKIGTATSVRAAMWEAARVYPRSASGCPLEVTTDQARALGLFAGG